jgi:hypothetical protein
MLIVAAVDLAAIIGLFLLAQSKQGVERVLPFASFLMVLVPIESLFPVGVFNLTTHRMIVGVLALLYVAKGAGTRQALRRVPTPLKVVMLVHVIWCLISTGNSIVPAMSVKKLLSVVLEYYLLYLMYYKTISQVETIRKVLMAMVAAIILCSVWGIGEAYRGWNILDYFPSVAHNFGAGNDDRAIRVQATFDHAILYGAALAMTITFDVYLLATVKKRWQKLFLWAGLLVMFLNLYQTGSRGPWLDAILGCLLLLIFGQKESRRVIAYVGVLCLAVLIVRPGVWGTIKGLYDNTLNGDTEAGSSYSYRQALPKAALQRLSESPVSRVIWGFGPESFYDLHLQGNLLGKPFAFLSCDDAWVEFLMETGFVGLLIMTVLLLSPMWVALRGYLRWSTPDRNLTFVLFLNLAIFYFQMYSVGMYSWGQNGYMLWIVISLAMADARLGKTLPKVPQARSGVKGRQIVAAVAGRNSVRGERHRVLVLQR